MTKITKNQVVNWLGDDQLYVEPLVNTLYEIISGDYPVDLVRKDILSYNEKIDDRVMTFPNGFDSWHETNYEVTSWIVTEANKDEPFGEVKERLEHGGRTSLYDLARELTQEFEEQNIGREWDGEFWEEIDEFCKRELKL